jgi:hypothetical protein
MQDMRDLEEDYLRRLREAQENGDKRHVPLIDETRICASGRIMTTKEITRETLRFLTKEGLGGVRD